uniref:Uncharacterized protein n=1 Tax=Anthurium amnicola TaxID=1678845 RepID=A0A1D1Y8I5_9ARAE
MNKPTLRTITDFTLEQRGQGAHIFYRIFSKMKDTMKILNIHNGDAIYSTGITAELRPQFNSKMRCRTLNFLSDMVIWCTFYSNHVVILFEMGEFVSRRWESGFVSVYSYPCTFSSILVLFGELTNGRGKGEGSNEIGGDGTLAWSWLVGVGQGRCDLLLSSAFIARPTLGLYLSASLWSIIFVRALVMNPCQLFCSFVRALSNCWLVCAKFVDGANNLGGFFLLQMLLETESSGGGGGGYDISLAMLTLFLEKNIGGRGEKRGGVGLRCS